MNSYLNSVLQTCATLKKHAIVSIVILFVIRFITAVITLPQNFGGLWRPKGIGVFPQFSSFFAIAFFLSILYSIQKCINGVSTKIKIYLWTYICYGYCVVTLSKSTAGSNYLYLWLNNDMEFEDFLNMFVVDLFFDSPYIFWCLCLMAIGLIISLKTDLNKLAVILCALPFILIEASFEAYSVVYMCIALVIAFFGVRYHRGRSPFLLTLLQVVMAFCILLFLHSIPSILVSSIRYEFVIFAVVFLPSLALIKSCEKHGNDADIEVSWLIWSVMGMFFYLISNIPQGNGFFHFIFSLTTFSFFGNMMIVFAGILLISCLSGIISRRLPIKIFALLNSLMIILYIADGAVFYKNGLRLDLDTIAWIAGMNDVFVVFKTATSFIDFKIFMVAILGLFIILLLKKMIAKPFIFGGSIPFTFACIFLMSQISMAIYPALLRCPNYLKETSVCLLESLPNVDQLFEEIPTFSKLSDGFRNIDIPFEILDEKAVEHGNGANIIIAVMESTHWRYLSMFDEDRDKTWPMLSTLKKRMEIFPFFFSNFPESGNADFTMITGLYPPDYQYLSKSDKFPEATVVEELKSAGYKCVLFSSGSIYDSFFEPFIRSLAFDHLYEPQNIQGMTRDDGWAWGLKEEAIVGKIVDLFSNNSDEQPLFVYYRMIYPHAPFTNMEVKKLFSETDLLKNQIVGRYKNSLLYQDQQLYRLISEIDKMKLKRDTYVLLVGDHGEMLGETGLFGHGRNATPELTNVPFIIIRPQETELKINDIVSSQIDVLPTILELVDLNGSRRMFRQGRSLLSSEDSDISLMLSSFQQYATVENGHYFHFPNKDSSECQVYKLKLDGSTPGFQLIEKYEKADFSLIHNRLVNFFKLQDKLLRYGPDILSETKASQD